MLGPAGIAAHPYVLAVAILLGTAVFLQAAHAAGLPVGRVALLIFCLIIAGLAGGRLYPMWSAGHWHWGALFELNYRHPGAIAALFLALPLLTRVLLPGAPVPLLADCMAPALAFSLAAYRMSCLLAGCCFGDLCTLPWAVRFPGNTPAAMLHHARGLIPSDSAASLPVHPLQAYFILLGLAVGFFLIRQRNRKSFDGELFLLFVAMHEGGKFALELLRGHPRPIYNPLFSLVAAVAATALLARFYRRKTPAPA